MNLSRHAFLFGAYHTLITASVLSVALSPLLLAGCGGSGGSDEVQVPANAKYPVTKVITSPSGRMQAITYARSGESPRTIIYRNVGDERFISQVLDATEPQATTLYEGRDNYVFWSPKNDKVFYITSSRAEGSDQWITKLNYDTVIASSQATVPFSFLSNSAADATLASYDRGRDMSTRFYPAGFSSDGSELLYTREVTTEQSVVVTRFSYNYKTAQTRELTP